MILSGRRVLVLQGEYLIALDLQEVLEKEGAVVTIGSQYDQNDDFDCILIDNNAAQRNADQLTSAGIPLVVYTGDVVIARRLFPNAVIIGKPALDKALITAVVTAIKRLAV